MNAQTAILPLLVCLTVGCIEKRSGPADEPASEQQPALELRTAEGVLLHFPSDVRSLQAWHGHQFIVGETPVIPTDKVPEETLMKHVGSHVTVTGVWHPGERWGPSAEEAAMQNPMFAEGGRVIRGDGILASSIDATEE